MKARALELRYEDLHILEVQLTQKIDAAKADGTDKSVIGELMLRYAGIRARMDEIEAWRKEDEQSVKYGQQIKVNGVWRPKLPEFGSVEKALEAMNSPTGGGLHSAAAVKAAREFRIREDSYQAVIALDGRSPLLSEEERKPFNTTL